MRRIKAMRLRNRIEIHVFLAAALFLPGLGAQPASPPRADELAKEFEAATIKPNTSGEGVGRFAGNPRGLRLENYTTRMILRMAFGNLPNDRMAGSIPKWVDSDHYDLNAVLPEGKRVGPPDMYQPPLQALLRERFRMKAHFEKKEFDVYELVVARGGHKLTANTDGQGPSGTNQSGRLTAKRLSMDTLANRFPGQAGRVVINKTGLTGEYDFELTWTPDTAAADPNNPGGPSIFTAVEEQLGLRLQPAKAPLEVLVIDSIEKPSEN